MTPRSCEEIRETLVDYTDGDLAERDSRVIAEHLAACPTCRKLADDLERSLHVATVIWRDNLKGSRVGPATVTTSRPAVRWLRHAGVAASILIVIGGALILSSTWKPTEPAGTDDEIERQVARTATAARLLAATQILATCEGTESIVQRQYRYILQHYGDTRVAGTLRTVNPVNLGEFEND